MRETLRASPELQTDKSVTTLKPDIVEVEPGVFSIILDGNVYEVRAAAETPWKRSSTARSATEAAHIVAPMPGKVIRILVAVEAQVEAGQGVIVVEAMKMQNEIKAPRAARIKEVRVREGENVDAGFVLVVLE